VGLYGADSREAQEGDQTKKKTPKTWGGSGVAHDKSFEGGQIRRSPHAGFDSYADEFRPRAFRRRNWGGGGGREVEGELGG